MFTHIRSNAHIRPSTNPRTALFLPLLAYALLAGLALGPVDTARAQTDVEPIMPKIDVEEAPLPGSNALGITSAPWRTYFGEHAAEVLREASPEAKKVALRDLITVASNAENVDLSETLTPLVGIFERGLSEDLSLMVLQALDVIGTEHSTEPRYRRAMGEVYRIAQKKSSDEVRRAAADVLQEFFGEEENG